MKNKQINKFIFNTYIIIAMAIGLIGRYFDVSVLTTVGLLSIYTGILYYSYKIIYNEYVRAYNSFSIKRIKDSKKYVE